MLVKYLQNLSAISSGSVIVLPSDLNDEGKSALLLHLFITSLNNFQVVLRSFLALSNLVSYVYVLRDELDGSVCFSRFYRFLQYP